MDVSQLFRQPLVEGHLGFFQFGMIIKNTYKNAPSSIIWDCIKLEVIWVPIPNRVVGENVIDECHGAGGSNEKPRDLKQWDFQILCEEKMKRQDELCKAFVQIKNTCIQNNNTNFSGTHTNNKCTLSTIGRNRNYWEGEGVKQNRICFHF